MSRARLLAASLVAFALCAVPLATVARGDAPPAWKDLQVLPKTITKDELKRVMKAQSKALGVECDHCHTPPDMSAMTDNKKIARDMMRMTDDINGKYLKGAKVKVECVTCHRGKEKPEIAK